MKCPALFCARFTLSDPRLEAWGTHRLEAGATVILGERSKPTTAEAVVDF